MCFLRVGFFPPTTAENPITEGQRVQLTNGTWGINIYICTFHVFYILQCQKCPQWNSLFLPRAKAVIDSPLAFHSPWCQKCWQVLKALPTITE